MEERTEVITDIPEDELERVVTHFKSEGATKVQRKQQRDGRWTITVVFADKGGSRDLP